MNLLNKLTLLSWHKGSKAPTIMSVQVEARSLLCASFSAPTVGHRCDILLIRTCAFYPQMFSSRPSGEETEGEPS